MISPILPAHDADTITLDFGVFVAEHARTYRTSQSAIIAALRPCIIPPQPEVPSHAPAAQTDGEAASPPAASPSVEPIQEPQPPVAPDQCAEANVAVQTVADVPPRPSSPAESEAVEISAPDTDKSVEPSGSAAPSENRAGTKRHAVRECHEAHPDWTSRQIAEHLGLGAQQVRVIVSHLGLPVPKPALKTQKKTVAPRPPGKKTTKALTAEVHAEHPDWSVEQIAKHIGRNPATVKVALHDAQSAERLAQTQAEQEQKISEARERERQRATATRAIDPEKTTLTERVRIMHEQRPTWTARMIANELGAPLSSVQTLLASARRSAEQTEDKPRFANRREMLDHYDAVGKRLGKAS